MMLVSGFRRLAITRPLQPCRALSTKQLHPKKFKSILQDVPPKPRSGWQIFLRENMKHQKGPDGKTNIIEANRVLSNQWKTLPEQEKEHYNAIYKKELAAHNEAYERAVMGATPQAFYEENQLRRKYKLKELKDPKAPKRPALGGYMLYLIELRKQDTAFASLPLMDQSTEASKRYKALPDHEKQRYLDEAKKAKDKYHQEKATYDAKINKKIKHA